MGCKEAHEWKLIDSVTKADFRHWHDVIYNRLDMAHEFKVPDFCFGEPRPREAGPGVLDPSAANRGCEDPRTNA